MWARLRRRGRLGTALHLRPAAVLVERVEEVVLLPLPLLVLALDVLVVVTVLVVLPPLLPVGERLVRLLHAPELRFSRRLLVLVGVVLLRQVAVGRLDVGLARPPADAQLSVEVQRGGAARQRRHQRRHQEAHRRDARVRRPSAEA